MTAKAATTSLRWTTSTRWPLAAGSKFARALPKSGASWCCRNTAEYRGKHLGQAVVAEAEKWMREAGFKKVEISSRVNVADFYEKMGYRFNESGKAHHDTFECVYMEKVL